MCSDLGWVRLGYIGFSVTLQGYDTAGTTWGASVLAGILGESAEKLIISYQKYYFETDYHNCITTVFF